MMFRDYDNGSGAFYMLPGVHVTVVNKNSFNNYECARRGKRLFVKIKNAFYKLLKGGKIYGLDVEWEEIFGVEFTWKEENYYDGLEFISIIPKGQIKGIIPEVNGITGGFGGCLQNENLIVDMAKQEGEKVNG